MRQVPSLMLWAWESPQDLRFLDKRVGVAFLSGELHFSDGSAIWKPRRNPLWVNPETYLIAVIRIESAERLPLTKVQQGAFLQQCINLTRLPRVRGIQVDFDARYSERAWYRDSLRELRAALPPKMPLSITALASWCWEDPWIRDLPVDEAIPMMFRMGSATPEFQHRLENGASFAMPIAQQSLGLSTDEPMPRMPPRRRIYIFHPGPWTIQQWTAFRAQQHR